MEMFSRILYHALDHLGYNDDMVKFRRESWKYEADLINECKGGGVCRSVAAGSKGEGISSIYESDIDTLFLYKSVLCISSADQLPRQLPNHVTVFLANMENVPPGYTRLKLYRPLSYKTVSDALIRESLFESENGELFLSSSLLTNSLKNGLALINKDGDIFHDVTGPAIPSTRNEIYATDTVAGFTILCPQILRAWATRIRRHEWPPVGVIEAVGSFSPQVVPVGAKGSERQFQEWRFCFIESELTLTHSLNGTQTKLYIVLKLIAKNILKQVTSEMSSYMMKNVTYWLSELLPLNEFTGEKLTLLVKLALLFLKTAISRRQTLPYYMIPSRDLLSERLDVHTRRELSDVLSRLWQEGPRLFLRIEKLKKWLQIASHSPNSVVRYGNMRDKIEKCWIAFCILLTFKKCGIQIDESVKYRISTTLRSLIFRHMNPDNSFQAVVNLLS